MGASPPKLSGAIDKLKEWRKKRKQKWRANRAVKKKEATGAEDDTPETSEKTSTQDVGPEKGKGKSKDSPPEKGKGKWKGGKKGSDWKGGKSKGKSDKGKATWPSKGAVGGKSKSKGAGWSGKTSKGKDWQGQWETLDGSAPVLPGRSASHGHHAAEEDASDVDTDESQTEE